MADLSLPERTCPLAKAVETQLRQLPVFDHALIAELDRRDDAGSLGARSTATLLVDALRITPGEARARVKAAENLGPRVGFGAAKWQTLFDCLAKPRPPTTVVCVTHVRRSSVAALNHAGEADIIPMVVNDAGGTSAPGPTVAAPTSTISPSSAVSTTASSSGLDGLVT